MSRIHMESNVSEDETNLEYFTLYWIHGERKVIKGTSIEDAFTKAGYGVGAIPAIDWYDNGVSETHRWDKENKTWVKYQSTSFMSDEENQFYRLKNVLKGIPIYDEFLSKVKGIGPAIAGIIISEIDIHKAEYPSSLHKYAGLDVVIVGFYKDDSGKEHTVPADQIEAYFAANEGAVEMLAEGKYPVCVKGMGRSRRDFCLENKSYVNKAGEEAVRRSITFNPFLKTKLIGVLGTSFLRTGTATVDGKKCGGARRLELAKKYGFDEAKHNDDVADIEVCKLLRQHGHDVVVEPSPYGKVYYDYRNRLENSPFHAEKTDAHRHNMAIRYAIKMFLIDCYTVWRRLEGLPVSLPYGEAKLGMMHGKAGGGKPTVMEKKAA